MTGGVQQLDSLLPPVKARLARREILGGRQPSVDYFARQGLALSPRERDAVAQWPGLRTRVCERHIAADGTRRLVVALGDGERVETVAMPVGAACVSTQVGCAVGCRFCASGIGGLRRNLTADEIVEQVVHARREMRIGRVVFMGMGEPSHNLDAVLAAVAVLHREGLISLRKQTLSTVGSVAALARLARAPAQPCLALSLHAADPRLRAWLLPRAPRDALPDLIAAADRYARACGTPVQFEWTVLGGVNDRDEDVDALCRLVRGAWGYVNFIVWNAVAGLPFAPPARARVVEMVRRVKRGGILATIRDSAGAEVHAACGQLRLRTGA